MSDLFGLFCIGYLVWLAYVAFTRPDQVIEDARERRRNAAKVLGGGFSLLSLFLKRRM